MKKGGIRDGSRAKSEMKLGKTYPCRVCGEMVFWAETSKGKKILLDRYSPVYFYWKYPRMGIRCEKVKHHAVSHFAGCPSDDGF